ncbi:sigma-70 family RNA polymerase sigma factor [Gordonia aichiensis]
MTSGQRPTGDDGGRAAGPTSEASTLSALLMASAGGDRAAFGRLYDLTSARIYGLALRVIRDVHYAEEVVQESYLQYWQKADQYHPERGSVITWMMTIAHRRAVDRVRTEELQQRKAAEYGAGNASTPHPIPLEVVVDREETRALRTCLDRLTELQRASIEMSYFNGMTYPEVAAVTATPLPTIKSRIRDGLRSLKKCMHGESDG